VGVCLCWIAVRGCPRDAAVEELGFEEGHAVDDLPDRIGIATLPNDWLLFVFNDDLQRAFDAEVTALSRHGPAVACAIEEHVMYHEARGYGGGEETWRMTHDPTTAHSRYHLAVTGQPPANFEAVHSKAVAQQDAEGGEDANVDFISEVPLKVAKSICGFRHDDAWPEGFQFTELRRARRATQPSGPGFFQRLFRRG
jgi:hypothetical protein